MFDDKYFNDGYGDPFSDDVNGEDASDVEVVGSGWNRQSETLEDAPRCDLRELDFN